ncbi:hypothetical protein T03_14726 [Trichinella britovi]|uniref:Uncharacterized protein n=2 Tax=Trichinella TaxID=6333 RepID=A0A0V1CNK3_TRIBR|nr:hypothetical protein T05_1067 [Trichinella murrelli]KRY50875.1 hypothetical protein T03_14726 [Trichinella britovi]
MTTTTLLEGEHAFLSPCNLPKICQLKLSWECEKGIAIAIACLVPFNISRLLKGCSIAILPEINIIILLNRLFRIISAGICISKVFHSTYKKKKAYQKAYLLIHWKRGTVLKTVFTILQGSQKRQSMMEC